MIDPDHHRLLAGAGRYVDDERREGALFMALLRSPVAHGAIEALDAAEAVAMPAVRLVLTAADLSGIGPMVAKNPVEGMIEPRRPVLAEDRVAYVGQPVVAIVADTPEAAMDGAEAIGLEIGDRPAVVDVAFAQDAPAIWPEAPRNTSFAWEKGNGDETDRLIAGAAHVVRLTVEHPRIAISPIEPRGCVAEHDAATGRYTLTVPSQGVVALRAAMAGCLGVPADRVRVLTHDVGGSFAAKIWPYPEHVLALVAAQRTGRPVRWTASRSDSFLGDVPGRARLDRGTLALDAEGRFLAFRIEALADMGAFLNAAAPSIVTQGAVRPFAQLYRIPGQHYRVEAVFTNAHPTDAYRGAGKPETTATLERLIDVAAGELGLDPLALRERNLIRPDALPLTTPMGEVMDAGDFPGHCRGDPAGGRLGRAAARRRAETEARGWLRGASIGFHLHATGGSTAERSEVRALPDGTVLVRTGAQDSGQGHRATLAMVAAEALELPPGRVRVEQGDSDRLEVGGGTGGSNLMAVAANTVHRTALEMLARARRLAGEMLEAAEADIEYGKGAFRVAGTDRGVTLAEVAARVGRGRRARLHGRARLRGHAHDLAERRLRLRGRGRPGDRRRARRPLRRRRRPRPRLQPAGGGRPAAGRHRAGHRRGADGGRALRRRRPAAERLVHGLRAAARGRRAVAARRVAADRQPERADRRQGRGRARLDRRAGGRRQRGPGCASSPGCAASRHAIDAGAGVAGVAAAAMRAPRAVMRSRWSV